MRIVGIEVIPVDVPLRRPYVIARGITRSFRNVVVTVVGQDGTVGLGECALYSVVGDLAGVCASLRDIARVLIGTDSSEFERLAERARPFVGWDLAPVAAMDMALWDLAGHQFGVPVYQLLGGRVNDAVKVDYTLGQESPADMAARAAEITSSGGFTGLCVKVGGGHSDVETDASRVEAVRHAVGPGIRIRLDANEGYRAEDAITLAKAVERFDIEFIEQPVSKSDHDGLARVCRESPVPISVDESLRTLSEAYRLATVPGIGVFNIKVPKCGGLHLSRKIAAVAESAGIRAICGGALALEVVRQASRHLSAATWTGRSGLHQEGPGPASQALAGNIASPVVGYDDVRAGGGQLPVSDAPGLGVDADRRSISRYAIRSLCWHIGERSGYFAEEAAFEEGEVTGT